MFTLYKTLCETQSQPIFAGLYNIHTVTAFADLSNIQSRLVFSALYDIQSQTVFVVLYDIQSKSVHGHPSGHWTLYPYLFLLCQYVRLYMYAISMGCTQIARRNILMYF